MPNCICCGRPVGTHCGLVLAGHYNQENEFVPDPSQAPEPICGMCLEEVEEGRMEPGTLHIGDTVIRLPQGKRRL